MKYLTLLLLFACSAPDPAPSVVAVPSPEPSPTPSAPASRYELGKKRFNTSCLACHGNPKVGRGSAPANWGSSEELLRAKVLSGSYPPGYKPKKPTRAMPKFPHLADEIINLTEYLNN